jgi:hypothetical protein
MRLLKLLAVVAVTVSSLSGCSDKAPSDTANANPHPFVFRYPSGYQTYPSGFYRYGYYP